MTVVAVVFFPIVLCYQIWGYYTFRKRLSVPRTDGSESPVDTASTETAAPAEAPAPRTPPAEQTWLPTSEAAVYAPKACSSACT